MLPLFFCTLAVSTMASKLFTIALVVALAATLINVYLKRKVSKYFDIVGVGCFFRTLLLWHLVCGKDL